MNRTLRSLLTLTVALSALTWVAAFAATPTIAAHAILTWTAPTTLTDGSPIANAPVTSYEIFVATAAIPDTGATAVATVTGDVMTTTQTVQAAPGDTIHARVAACNVSGCSALSVEGTKVVSVPAPGVPTSVTIAITIG